MITFDDLEKSKKMVGIVPSRCISEPGSWSGEEYRPTLIEMIKTEYWYRWNPEDRNNRDK